MHDRSNPQALPDDARALLDALEPADRAHLLELCRQTRERQHRQMTDAIDEVLRAVPFVLRGAVRRLLTR